MLSHVLYLQFNPLYSLIFFCYTKRIFTKVDGHCPTASPVIGQQVRWTAFEDPEKTLTTNMQRYVNRDTPCSVMASSIVGFAVTYSETCSVEEVVPSPKTDAATGTLSDGGAAWRTVASLAL